MIDGEVEEIIRGLIDRAKNGDFRAQKLLLERMLPPLRSRAPTIGLPLIETPSEIVTAYSVVWAAVREGQLTLEDAERLVRLLEAKQKAIETSELAAEVERIKEHLELVR